MAYIVGDQFADGHAPYAETLRGAIEDLRHYNGNDEAYHAACEHASALADRVERLQRLWQAWSAAAGYSTASKRWTAFAAALKACEDAGDLLPEEDAT